MPNQHMVPADCLYILQVVVPYTVLRIREGMGPVAQPYDLYITVCLRLHDGPVAVTGWDVRKTEWKPWLAGVVLDFTRALQLPGTCAKERKKAYCVCGLILFTYIHDPC